MKLLPLWHFFRLKKSYVHKYKWNFLDLHLCPLSNSSIHCLILLLVISYSDRISLIKAWSPLLYPALHQGYIHIKRRLRGGILFSPCSQPSQYNRCFKPIISHFCGPSLDSLTSADYRVKIGFFSLMAALNAANTSLPQGHIASYWPHWYRPGLPSPSLKTCSEPSYPLHVSGM